MKPSLSSVRGRTTAVAVLLVGFILFVWAASLVIFVDNAIDKKLDAGEAARNVAAQVRRGTLPTVLAVPGEEADDVFIQVVDAGGNVVAATRNLAGEAPVTDVRPRTGEELRTVIESLPPVDLDDRFRVLGIQAAAADGPVSIYVGTEWERVEESVDALSQALRFGAPGLLVLSAGLVWWLVGRALRPVESIRAQVAEITETELDRRVPEPAVNDEIGRLARTMNDMLDRLQRATDRQRRFVADASHELRSPLAISRTQLEIAAAHPEAVDMGSMVDELLADNHRMERLVADLLFLARRDERGAEPVLEPVALDELMRQEAARVRRVAVNTARVVPVPVLGQADDLVRAVRNLIENAERHARSTITLSLRVAGDGVELVVADDGSGVPVERREEIFDRFTRLDEARSRDEGGSGLGLPIVRDIVSAHGGSVVAEGGPGAGARFVVRLPLGVPADQPPSGSRR